MRKIRVVVADDSLTVRKRIVEILESDPLIEVVGEGGDGKEAIELTQRLRPDVVTLDMMMPQMTGLAATEYIMAYCPTPILIVSSSVNRGEIFRTYDALAAGAVEVLDKAKATETGSVWEKKLIDTVKLVSRIRVITHPRGRRYERLANLPPTAAPGPTVAQSAIQRPAEVPASSLVSAAVSRAARIVAIGASTGGPSAIRELLCGLPADFAVPVLFVIHIGEPFGSIFAEWLDGNSPIRVATARDGEPVPAPGEPRVLIGPPDLHLAVDAGRIRLLKTPERHSCRPSVDVLFESVAREYGADAIGCLLTGMGRDGASGLLAMRQAGAVTLAQDESSSVVYGMPKEAVLLGAAAEVLPIDELGPRIALLGSGKSLKKRRSG